MYHNLLQIEIKSIFETCLLQRQLNLSWDDLKSLIHRDIQKYSKKIDNYIEELTILNIRKWMELWMNVDEYHILNIMRWFNSSE